MELVHFATYQSNHFFNTFLGLLYRPKRSFYEISITQTYQEFINIKRCNQNIKLYHNSKFKGIKCKKKHFYHAQYVHAVVNYDDFQNLKELSKDFEMVKIEKFIRKIKQQNLI